MPASTGLTEEDMNNVLQTWTSNPARAMRDADWNQARQSAVAREAERCSEGCRCLGHEGQVWACCNGLKRCCKPALHAGESHYCSRCIGVWESDFEDMALEI